MVSLAALLLVKSVLSVVNLTVTKKLVFCSNCISDSWSLEQVKKSAVWDDFALENPVEP